MKKSRHYREVVGFNEIPTQFVKVHAVVLGTGLVLHEVAAVLSRPQRCLQRPAVDVDVVDGLDGS